MKSLKTIIDSADIPEPSELKSETGEAVLFDETSDETQVDHKNAELVKELIRKAREDVHKLEIENENLKKLADHRIQYSWGIYGFVFFFVTFSLAIVVLSGLKVLQINDNVLDVLLGTNMIQVVGVLYIVAKWLYPNNKK